MLPEWAGEYVGIRWTDRGRDKKTGLDCWGLVWLVLTERFGLELPPFIVTPESADAEEELASIQEQTGPWINVPKFSGQIYDVVQMKTFIRDGGSVRSEPRHAGILLAPDRLLHVEENTKSVIVRYGPTEQIARGGRVVDVWRWDG